MRILFSMDEQSILRGIQERLDSFVEPPKLGNQFLEDSALRDYIGLYFSEFGLDSSSEVNILETLVGLGERVIDYAKDSQLAEMMPPTLQLFDAYGKKVNRIHVPESMERLRKAALKEKIITDMYNLQQGVASRFVQMIKLYLFHASSGMWGGPMAVTDGAASLIQAEVTRVESSGNLDPASQKYLADIKKCFNNLTSSNPDQSWIAGQWTMEKEGHIEPIDRIQSIALGTDQPRVYKLYGVKWYTATPQGDISIALARIVDPATKKPQDRLSAFLVNIKGPGGQLKPGIDIIRLKDKLGTKTIPAAELALKGVEGTLLAAPGEGVKIMSSMTAVTRLYNAAAAVSYARRVHVLCKDYSMR